jgi:RimJ/RimL family protein N-acetyltransferase
MIIQGNKVTLRPMTVEEIPLFFEWATQSDAAPYWYGELSGDQVPTFEEFLKDWKRYYFDGSEPDKGRCFMILIDDTAIGQINYNEIDRKNNSVDLDILIAEDKGRCSMILIDDTAIGQINYNEIDRKNNSVDLDILIAEDRYKNKGYGTDALQALTGYLFGRMGIQTCWIDAAYKNPRAIRAYQKAGFKIIKKFVDMGIECLRLELKSPDLNPST